MPYSYNPANAAERKFAVLPEGEYEIRIDKAYEGVSKSSGTNMMTLELSVSSFKHFGSRLWYYVPYDENAADKFRQILRSCGLPDVMQEIDPDLLEGEVGRVKVKHELYQGERKAKVHYWIDADSEPEPDSEPAPVPTAEDEPLYTDPLPF